MNNWKFKITSSFEDIFSNNRIEQWNRFFNSAEESHVFFHSALVKAWIDTYVQLRKIKPIFVIGRSPKNNIVFMPFVLWYRNWKNAFVKSIIPVGYSDYDYHDPIFLKKPTKEERETFWQELIPLLRAFSVDEILIDGIVNKPQGLNMIQGEICPRLSLTSFHNSEDLLASLKTSLRGDIRRQMRRLSEHGELSIKIYNSFEEAKTTFEKFMIEHRAKWPNAYKAPRFHENLLKFGLPAEIVDFTSLNVGNKQIAWHLGFKWRGKYFYYMPCGDLEFSSFSPVKIHLFKLIEQTIFNNFTLFDHLRGDETYKEGWSNGCQYVNTLKIQSTRPTTKLKNQLSEFLHRLRA